MSLSAWIVAGLITGFIASKIVNKTGQGVAIDLVLGIVGAVIAGWLFSTSEMAGGDGLDLSSILVAVIGAALLLAANHVVSRRAG